MPLLMRGMSARRISMATRAAPCSSASAALSTAEAPAPMHADHLAAQRVEIDVVDRMAHVARVEPAEHRRRVGAAEPVAPVRQHDAARRDLAGAGARAQRQHDELAVAAKVDQLGLVLDRHVDHRAGTSADSPSIAGAECDGPSFHAASAELRLEPGAEGQIGKAERRPGQLRRRAQRLHAGDRSPTGLRSLPASGRTSAASAPRGI